MPCTCPTNLGPRAASFKCICVFDSSDEESCQDDSCSEFAVDGSIVKSERRNSSSAKSECTSLVSSFARRPQRATSAPPEATPLVGHEQVQCTIEPQDDSNTIQRTFKLVQIREKLNVVLTSPNSSFTTLLPLAPSCRLVLSEDGAYSTQSLSSNIIESVIVVPYHNLGMQEFERVEQWRYQVGYEYLSNPLKMDPSIPFQGLFNTQVLVGATPVIPSTPSTPTSLAQNDQITKDTTSTLPTSKLSIVTNDINGYHNIPFGADKLTLPDEFLEQQRRVPQTPSWQTVPGDCDPPQLKFLHKLFHLA